MKKLIVVAVAVLSLSGCVVNTPAPAPQVTAVASAPAKSGEVWCFADAKSGKEAEQHLGLVFLTDNGNSFSVRNREGKTVLTSPMLNIPASNSMTATDSKGLLYSKGTQRFAGFYGVFRNYTGGQDYLTFNCR